MQLSTAKAAAAFHFVQVAIGQAVRIQETAVGLLDAQIQALKIGRVLIGAGFGAVLDNPQRHRNRPLGRDAAEVVHLVGEGLEESLLTAVADVGLLDVGAEIELLPLRGIGRAVGVISLEFVAILEMQLPDVLAHRIAPDAAAGAIVDVVVNDAVVDQRGRPDEFAAAV